MTINVPLRERLTCSVAEAAAYAGLSENTIHNLIGAGKLASSKVGTRRLVAVRSLVELIDPEAPPSAEPAKAA